MSGEHDEHDEHDAHQNRAGKGYNTLAKITLGGAIVGGAVFAMTKFVSVWKNGEAKKRKFTDWFPNAIDDSAQSFKQAFAALSSDNTELEHSNESGETEDDKMIVGFAYGANAERQQWFNAQWHETSENSVRVEYLMHRQTLSSLLMVMTDYWPANLAIRALLPCAAPEGRTMA